MSITQAKIGIIAAMQEEISELLSELKDPQIQLLGSREYHSGRLHNHDVVIVLSRIGKVAAASTATTMIDNFAVSKIIMTGVAGAISLNLNIGDVVIAESLLQHDMDASAVMGFKKYEVPLSGKIFFDCDAGLVELAEATSRQVLANLASTSSSKAYRGIIASGDQFITAHDKFVELRQEIPNLLAVEMEGAALAQVCHEWNVPFVVLRTISDNADHNSHLDFPQFVSKFAAPISKNIILELLNRL